jgi:hypothetical protein
VAELTSFQREERYRASGRPQAVCLSPTVLYNQRTKKIFSSEHHQSIIDELFFGINLLITNTDKNSKMRSRFLNLLVLCLIQDQILGFSPVKLGPFIKPNSATLFAGTLIESGDLANKTTAVVIDKVTNVEDKKKVGKNTGKKSKALDKEENQALIPNHLIVDNEVVDDAQTILDIDMMKKAIQLAQSR